jgi:YegS/Rv2252/BmrU family lipid kinase
LGLFAASERFNLMKNRVLFIINRHSGRHYRQSLEREIMARGKQCGMQPTLEFTGHPGHATELAARAAAANCPLVFAVGGDGTVNEVARGLVRTATTMGIVPRGSGNGLARHLGIPMNPVRALDQLPAHRQVAMDAMRINGQYSFNVSGIGFDGYIARLFGQNGKRGLSGYVNLIMREFPRFREFRVEAQSDGRPLEAQAFILAFANSSQFGNGATIAPAASVCDGRLDICLISKPSCVQAPGFLRRLFMKKLDRSSLVRISRAREFKVILEQPMAFHLDGEPFEPGSHFSVRLEPACLKILVPASVKRV